MAPGAHQTAPVMNLEERCLPERLFLAFLVPLWITSRKTPPKALKPLK